MKIAFVGCGAAGRPLGIAWRRAGYTIGAVHARTSARQAVAELGAGVPGGALDDADVVVFATPDDALADVAGRYLLSPEQIAVHLSGVHPSTILEPTGARTGSLHPLCAFADVETALAALPHTYFFVEGDPAALMLARDLGGNVVPIATAKKALYHAAAALASNYTVTLIALARDMFVEAGVPEDTALAALVQLVRGSIDNVEAVGLPHGLTGPAARGDIDVIRRHVEALAPEQRPLYLRLLEATMPLALAKGNLSAKAAAAFRQVQQMQD